MILVDTSVWIDHFRGVDSPEARRLSAGILASEDICICGIILTEILQGVKATSQYRNVKRRLRPLIYLPAFRSTYVRAADIYRAARRRGKAVRSTIDCLIAACAIQHDVPLLTGDRDFDAIAEVVRLRLARPG